MSCDHSDADSLKVANSAVSISIKPIAPRSLRMFVSLSLLGQPKMDFTRFNRHLLRSKLNCRVSHEESQIPGGIQS